MRNIFLIIRREFLTRVRKRSFLVLTFLAPIIFAIAIFAYVKLMQTPQTEVVNVKIADNTGLIAPQIQSNNLYNFEIIDYQPLDSIRHKYFNSTILYIAGDKGEIPQDFAFYSNGSVNLDLQNYVRQYANSIIEKQKLKAYNIENLEEIMAKVRTNVNLRTIKWEKGKADKETNTGMVMAISYVLALVIYMFIFMFGSMVMRGVIEEKSNRIIEVIISSTKPFQLMIGKITGIAFVGILQFVLWVVLTVVFFNIIQMFSAQSQGGALVGNIMSAFAGMDIIGLLIYFLLFFVGGYLLYASMFAAVGSAVESEGETQQMMMPITIPLIFAIMIMIHTFRYPDSTLSFWASIIPFTSPIVMVARIPFGVPFEQILLSLGVLYASFVFMCYVTARIYRVGILMYGKKPSFKEIIKWLKYK